MSIVGMMTQAAFATGYALQDARVQQHARQATQRVNARNKAAFRSLSGDLAVARDENARLRRRAEEAEARAQALALRVLDLEGRLGHRR